MVCQPPHPSPSLKKCVILPDTGQFMSVRLLYKYLSDVVPEDGAFVLTETSRNTKKLVSHSEVSFAAIIVNKSSHLFWKMITFRANFSTSRSSWRHAAETWRMLCQETEEDKGRPWVDLTPPSHASTMQCRLEWRKLSGWERSSLNHNCSFVLHKTHPVLGFAQLKRELIRVVLFIQVCLSRFYQRTIKEKKEYVILLHSARGGGFVPRG